MKQILFTLCLSMITTIFLGQTADITIKVIGVEEVKGAMSIALYDKEEDFRSRDRFVAAEDVPIESNTFTYTFKEIPYGTYAIAVFHDLDEDRELRKNWVGMPKEPFGFSNDAKGKMGPPSYDDASFILKEDLNLTINLIEL